MSEVVPYVKKYEVVPKSILAKIRKWAGLKYLKWVFGISLLLPSCNSTDDSVDDYPIENTIQQPKQIPEKDRINNLVYDITIKPGQMLSSESFIKPDAMSDQQFALFEASFWYLVSIKDTRTNDINLLANIMFSDEFESMSGNTGFAEELKKELDDYYGFYKPKGDFQNVISAYVLNKVLIKYFGFVLKDLESGKEINFNAPSTIMMFEKVDAKLASSEDIKFITDLMNDIFNDVNIKFDEMYITNAQVPPNAVAMSHGGVIAFDRGKFSSFKSSAQLKDGSIITFSEEDVIITEIAHQLFKLYLSSINKDIEENIDINEFWGEIVGLSYEESGYWISHFNMVLSNINDVPERYYLVINISREILNDMWLSYINEIALLTNMTPEQLKEYRKKLELEFQKECGKRGI